MCWAFAEGVDKAATLTSGQEELREGEEVVSSMPHPIPYQGSKRKLAGEIGRYVPKGVRTFYEPFAGSAAMTVYAAHHGMAEGFVVGDSLGPLVALLRSIVDRPGETAGRYLELWEGQEKDNWGYFNEVRERFNEVRERLICCI